MKAFVIDPITRTVAEVDYNGDYRQIYKLIDADTFDAVTVQYDTLTGHRESLFVDDEGLFKADQKFFHWADYPQPLAGKALLLGTDDTGESVATKQTISEVERQVRWDENDLQYLGGLTTVDEQAELFGKPAVRIVNTPVFSKGK
jgi:hypothetical protein